MARAALFRVSLLAIACIGAAVVARGQTAAPRLAPEIEELIRTASSLRTEYSADILLRLAESRKIADPAQRRELLERIFDSASSAVEPFPLTDVISTGDTLERVFARSFNLRLDALSIRLRAVEVLFKDDPRSAREMFARIPPLVLPPTGCDRALIPKVDAFYAVAQALFDHSFTKAERDNEEDIAFLRVRMTEVTSLAQLFPVLQIVRRFPTLGTPLAAQLGRLDAGDREWRALQTELEAASGAIASPAILDAWRALVASHAQAAQCSDSSATITPLEPPERLRGLLRPLDALRDGTATPPEGWQIGVTKFLDELAGYRAESAGEEAVVFENKSALYFIAIDRLPDGPLLGRAIEDYLGFLTTSPLRAAHPMEWLQSLDHVAHSANAGPRIRAAMNRSADSVIAAYGALESIAPRKN